MWPVVKSQHPFTKRRTIIAGLPTPQSFLLVAMRVNHSVKKSVLRMYLLWVLGEILGVEPSGEQNKIPVLNGACIS